MRRKFAIICALIGAVLSFLVTRPEIVRFVGKTVSFPGTKNGINLMTQSSYSPYRTTKNERTFGSNNYFCLEKSESGFSFIKNILQRNYYKKIENNILLFVQWQPLHMEGDPYNPETTYRPIYGIPQNEETEKLNFQRNIAYQSKDKEKLDKVMGELMLAKIYISNQNRLIMALDDYYKTNILFLAMLFMVLSILLNNTYIRMKIDFLDLLVRSASILVFVYIIYSKTSQQIIAIVCLMITFWGTKRINEYISFVIDKFRQSQKGSFPLVGGDYDISMDVSRKVEAPVSLNKIIYDAILQSNENDRFNLSLAKSMESIRLKEWSKAAIYIEAALEVKPDDFSLRSQLIVIYGEYMGDKEKAIYHCNKILAKDPNNVSAKFNLAVYTNHLKGSEYSLPIYRETEELMKKQKLMGSELDGKLNIFIGHDIRNLESKVKAKERYEKAITILKSLAEKGDRASEFWLRDAEKNLKDVIVEIEKEKRVSNK